MTHEIELDKGILEKLMSNKETNQAEICQARLLNNSRNQNSSTKNEDNKDIYEGVNDENDDEFEDDSLAPTLNPDDILLPIVQVINIQNIATSAVVTKYNSNSNNNNNNKSSSSSCSSSSNETEETEDSKNPQNSKENKKRSHQKHKNTLSNDRYLLILSDGEYYETRCLLLPNLNYLVNRSKLRKGSIIRLDRFEINLIPNGKILVIDQLTVLKNTIQINLNTNDNERKSIMNNNLADTLKSIGIIGSLKPTSNNTQLKIRVPQQQQQIKQPQSEQINTVKNTNLNKNESTDKNNNKNKYKEDELEEDDEYEDVDEDDEEEDVDEDDEFEDEDDYEDEEDELDYEDDLDEDEDDDDQNPNSDKNFKSVVDIILCKCSSCKEQNTLKLCYKLLGLDENASIEQMKEKYLMLTNNSNTTTTSDQSLTNTDLQQQQEINNECNLDKLIRKLLKKKIFTITDSDRQEIRSKAYNLILKIKSNDESTKNVPINTLLSTLTISKASSILNNIDRKLLIRKRIVNANSNNEANNNNNNNNNNQEAQIEDYLQYAWMKIANEFIRHEKQQTTTVNTDNDNTNKNNIINNNNNNKNKQLEQKTKENNTNANIATTNSTSKTNKTVKQMNEIRNKKVNEQITSNETTCSTTTTTTTTTATKSNATLNHLNHHYHHHHHLNCRRKINRNPKAFYQQIKKNNKTHSIKAMRNKQKQEAAALAAASVVTSCAEVAVPSPFMFTNKKEEYEEDSQEELVPFDCKLGNFLVDFNNRPAVLNDILNEQNELKNEDDVEDDDDDEEENDSNKEEDLTIKTESTSLTIKRIEKDLEQHLDSLKLIKEKLSLTSNCENSNINNNNNETTSKPATAKKRKNDNSLVATASAQSISKSNDEQEILLKQLTLNSSNKSNNNKKNKKKKNKKTNKTLSKSSQLNIAIPSFNLPLISSSSSTKQTSDHDLVLKEKLKLELEQEQLEKQLIEQQKIQQLQIEQLQKQIDEFEAESAAAAAAATSTEQINVLEAVLNENDLSQVLNNLSEALVKSNENDNKNISESLQSLKSIDKIEKLKKLESIEKALCSQEFSFKQLEQQQQQQNHQSVTTTEILKSKLMQLESKKLNKKCISCAKSDQSLSLMKLNEKEKSLFSKLKNAENDEYDNYDDEDDCDDENTDENESLSEEEDEVINNNNTIANNKDQFNIIIMKQTKNAQLNENKIKQQTNRSGLMLNKNEKRCILIKDVVEQLSLVNSSTNGNEDDDDDEEVEDDDEEEDEEDEDDDDDDDEYYEEDDENDDNKNSIPSVEELIKTIHDDEENIIFVQSLSSLAKKTLFNQQLNQQRKLKRKQQNSKEILISDLKSNTIIRLGSCEQVKSSQQESGKVKQQQDKKNDFAVNKKTSEIKNEKKLSESSNTTTTTTNTTESIKLSKSQKKRIRKQLNKKNSLANTTTNSESVPETTSAATTMTSNQKESTQSSETPVKIANENSNRKNSKKKKQKQQQNENQTQQQQVEQNKNDKTASTSSKKNKKSKKKSSETNNNNNNSKQKQENMKTETNVTPKEAENPKPPTQQVDSKTVTKKINDISDFSEPDEELKRHLERNENESVNNSNSKVDLKQNKKNESNSSTSEDSDQGGDWVKVAGNRLLITETKKPKKQAVQQQQQQQQTATASITSKKPVKVSSSLNSLDSFTSQDITVHPLKKTIATDSSNQSKTNENKLSVDLLIPSTIDEEDEMLKKALELSLKETKMNSETQVDNSSASATKKTSNKLGLDDFNDDTIPIKPKTPQVNPQSKPLQQQAKTNLNKQQPMLAKPPVANLSRVNLAKPQVSQPILPSNRPVNTGVTSFAAAAASQPKSKQASSSSIIVSSQPPVLNQQTKQPFKWNKPNETQKANPVEPVIKSPVSTITTTSPAQTNDLVKRKASSSSTKDFKDNGVDLPLSDVVSEVKPSVPFVTSNLEQLSLNSFDKKDDHPLLVVESIKAPVSNPFLTINNLFSSSTSPVTATSTRLEAESKSDLFGLVSDIAKSPLITPSSSVAPTAFGTLPSSSIVGSNILMPDQASVSNPVSSIISPIKKPIGAERSMNTQRATNSISPPLIKLPIPAQNTLSNAALIHPIRPASTAPTSGLTPAKSLNTQLSASNSTLNAKPNQNILSQASSDLVNPLSPNQVNLTDSSVASAFRPEIAPNQKQMIRVPPQQKLSNSMPATQQQTAGNLSSADQLNKLKQQQQIQQQQQQQQTLINNLVMLLANNNNINSMDPNQLANTILYLNQLMSQQPQMSSTEPNFQSVQQKLNDTTSSLLKNLTHHQQQLPFNTAANQATSWNSFDNFSQPNLFKQTLQSSNLQQQQQQQHQHQGLFLNSAKPTNNLWSNGDYQPLNKSNYSNNGLLTTNTNSTTTPSPPPITNSTTSSSSSIIMQSSSSTSSSPSPHLINPMLNPPNPYISNYNYFGSNNLGNTTNQAQFQLNNSKHSLVQTAPNQNLIVGSSNMQFRSNAQMNNNTGVNQLYSSFSTNNNLNTPVANPANTNYLFNTQNNFYPLSTSSNSSTSSLMPNLSNVTMPIQNSAKLLPNPIGLRSSSTINSAQQLNTPVTQIPKNPAQTSFIRNNQLE